MDPGLEVRHLLEVRVAEVVLRVVHAFLQLAPRVEKRVPRPEPRRDGRRQRREPRQRGASARGKAPPRRRPRVSGLSPGEARRVNRSIASSRARTARARRRRRRRAAARSHPSAPRATPPCSTGIFASVMARTESNGTRADEVVHARGREPPRQRRRHRAFYSSVFASAAAAFAPFLAVPALLRTRRRRRRRRRVLPFRIIIIGSDGFLSFLFLRPQPPPPPPLFSSSVSAGCPSGHGTKTTYVSPRGFLRRDGASRARGRTCSRFATTPRACRCPPPPPAINNTPPRGHRGDPAFARQHRCSNLRRGVPQPPRSRARAPPRRPIRRCPTLLPPRRGGSRASQRRDVEGQTGSLIHHPALRGGTSANDRASISSTRRSSTRIRFRIIPNVNRNCDWSFVALPGE